MMLIAYIALGTAFTIFLHRFTIRQFPISNSSALSNVVTSFAMWPFQAVFLIIAATAFGKFGIKGALTRAVKLMANCYIANMNAIICAFMLCTSFIMIIAIQHFKLYSGLDVHLHGQCSNVTGARLALLVLLIQLIFLIRIVQIGSEHRRRIAASIRSDFLHLLKD